jgi:hypothetical protein
MHVFEVNYDRKMATVFPEYFEIHHLAANSSPNLSALFFSIFTPNWSEKS